MMKNESPSDTQAVDSSGRRALLAGLVAGAAGLVSTLTSSTSRATLAVPGPTPALKIYDVTDVATYPTPQDAINAAGAAGGGIVYFPPGTYTLTSYLSVSSSNIALIGSGPSSIIQAASGAGTLPQGLIQVGTASDITIRDLVLDWQGQPLVANTGVITAIGCSRLEIDQCTVRGWDSNGLYISGTTYFSVSRCTIERATVSNAQNYALLVTATGGRSSFGRILDNHLTNSGVHISAFVCAISGNWIEGFGYDAGITTDADYFGVVPNSAHYRITNNYITGGVGMGSNNVVCQGVNNFGPYSVIQGNQIISNAGVAIDNAGRGTTISNNVCVDNCGYWAPYGGEHAIYNHNFTVGGHPYSGDNTVVTKNVCLETRAPSSAKGQGWGYGDDAGVCAVQVSGNSFLGSRNAIVAIQSTRCRFVGDVLQFVVAWNVGTLTAGSSVTKTMGPATSPPTPATGVVVGDLVTASIEGDAKGCVLAAGCSGADTLVATLVNRTGTSQDVGTVTLRFFAAKNQMAATIP